MPQDQKRKILEAAAKACGIGEIEFVDDCNYVLTHKGWHHSEVVALQEKYDDACRQLTKAHEIIDQLLNQLDAEADDLGDILAQVKLKNEILIAERDQLREQVKMLQEFMPYVVVIGYEMEQKYLKALAATEPKE